MLHEKRFYRLYSSDDRWKTFNVRLHTTDLYIRALADISAKAQIYLAELRKEIEDHIKVRDLFLTSLEPLNNPENSTPILSMMYEASKAAGTGPMAAVAGAIAECTGKKLLGDSPEIIVENGGDVWMKLNTPVTMGIYCDNIHFRDRLALKINNDQTPCAVCTSSSKTGHSLSFGKADSVTIIAGDGAFADAAATETCNRVTSDSSITDALNFALSVPSVRGCLIIYRDILAVMGDMELVPPS